jgi:hypothetical protein
MQKPGRARFASAAAGIIAEARQEVAQTEQVRRIPLAALRACAKLNSAPASLASLKPLAVPKSIADQDQLAADACAAFDDLLAALHELWKENCVSSTVAEPVSAPNYAGKDGHTLLEQLTGRLKATSAVCREERRATTKQAGRVVELEELLSSALADAAEEKRLHLQLVREVESSLSEMEQRASAGEGQAKWLATELADERAVWHREEAQLNRRWAEQAEKAAVLETHLDESRSASAASIAAIHAAPPSPIGSADLEAQLQTLRDKLRDEEQARCAAEAGLMGARNGAKAVHAAKAELEQRVADLTCAAADLQQHDLQPAAGTAPEVAGAGGVQAGVARRLAALDARGSEQRGQLQALASRVDRALAAGAGAGAGPTPADAGAAGPGERANAGASAGEEEGEVARLRQQLSEAEEIRGGLASRLLEQAEEAAGAEARAKAERRRGDEYALAGLFVESREKKMRDEFQEAVRRPTAVQHARARAVPAQRASAPPPTPRQAPTYYRGNWQVDVLRERAEEAVAVEREECARMEGLVQTVTAQWEEAVTAYERLQVLPSATWRSPSPFPKTEQPHLPTEAARRVKSGVTLTNHPHQPSVSWNGSTASIH